MAPEGETATELATKARDMAEDLSCELEGTAALLWAIIQAADAQAMSDSERDEGLHQLHRNLKRFTDQADVLVGMLWREGGAGRMWHATPKALRQQLEGDAEP